MLTTVILVWFGLYLYESTNIAKSREGQYLQTYEPTKIVDKDNNVIWKPTNKHVDVLGYKEIPSLYKDALIAVEDKDY